MRASLAYYYGWTPLEINSLSFVEAMKYYKALSIIQAKENLLKLQIADYPHAEKKSRNKFFNAIKKEANKMDNRKPLNTEEFAKLFARKINGR